MALIYVDRTFDITDLDQTILKPCLPDKYEQGIFIGLGLTNQDPETQPTQLMEVTLNLDDQCGNYNSVPGFLRPPSQLCYSLPGMAAPCNGDSGGPIVYMEDGRPNCLIGISSFYADRCDDPDYPSVFQVVTRWIRRRWGSFQLSRVFQQQSSL